MIRALAIIGLALAAALIWRAKAPREVWSYLESIPGFNEDLRAAEMDLEGGRGVRWEDDGVQPWDPRTVTLASPSADRVADWTRHP